MPAKNNIKPVDVDSAYADIQELVIDAGVGGFVLFGIVTFVDTYPSRNGGADVHSFLCGNVPFTVFGKSGMYIKENLLDLPCRVTGRLSGRQYKEKFYPELVSDSVSKYL